MRGESVGQDAVRFLIAGGLNTAVTSSTYFLGVLLLPPTVSYALAWLIGLAFVAAFYPDRVFPGGRRAMSDRLALILVMLTVFCAGLAILGALVEMLGDHRYAFVSTLAITTVLNFVLARLALRRR